MRGGLGPDICSIPTSLSLPPMRGAAVGRAPTNLYNLQFCLCTARAVFRQNSAEHDHVQAALLQTCTRTVGSVAQNIGIVYTCIVCVSRLVRDGNGVRAGQA